MSVSNSDARLLLRDVARLASDANASHLGILAKNRRTSVRISIFLLAVNTLLTSALWSSLTRDAPAPWLKYSGLALSLIAAFASGLVVALDQRRQNELSLEATKVYGNVVFEATRFRISVEGAGALSAKEETELFRIFKLHNDMASKAGDRLAQLQDSSVWSERPAASHDKASAARPGEPDKLEPG